MTPDGPGVTLPAHADRAVVVRILIEYPAVREGYLRVRCGFGEQRYTNGDIAASAIVRVPGSMREKVSGQVTLPPGMAHPEARCGCSGPRPGLPVPDLKDQFTGAVLGRATTDTLGAFEFHDIPPGLHDRGVVGPWKIVAGGPTLPITAVAPRFHLVHVEPGPDQADPEPPQPGGPPAPTPGAGGEQRPAEHLASTGVDVAWLAHGGPLTVPAGAGPVFRTRRKVT